MAIEFLCPNCQKLYVIAERFVGRIATCRACRTLMRVPGGETLDQLPTEADPEADVALMDAIEYAARMAAEAGPENEQIIPPNVPLPAPPIVVRKGDADDARWNPSLSLETAKTLSWILFLAALLINGWTVGRLSNLIAAHASSDDWASIRLFMFLSISWHLLIFFVIEVPLVVGTIGLACLFTRRSLPESSYLRTVAVIAFPSSLVPLWAMLRLEGYRPEPLILILTVPILMIVLLRALLDLEWSSWWVSIGLLIVVGPVWAVLMVYLNSYVTPALASFSGMISPVAPQIAQQPAPPPAAVVSAPYSPPAPAPPRDMPRADPGAFTIGPIIDSLNQLKSDADQSTREDLQARYKELSQTLADNKPAEASATWDHATTLLSEIEPKIAAAPSGVAPDDLDRPVEGALAIMVAPDDAFGGDQYCFGDLLIRPLKKMRVDLRAYNQRDKLLRWKIGDNAEYGIEMEQRPVDDAVHQQRPWIASRPVVEQIAAEQKRLALSVSPDAHVTRGTINHIGWTRIEGRPPGASEPAAQVRYAARVGSEWILISVFSNVSPSPSTVGDEFIQGLHMAQPDDPKRSPFEPALVVDEFSHQPHDDPGPILRAAGEAGIRGLRTYYEKINPASADARELLKQLTERSITDETDIDLELQRMRSGDAWDRTDAMKQIALAPVDEAHREAVASALEHVLTGDASIPDRDAAAGALSKWWRSQTLVELLPLLDENSDVAKRPAAMRVLAATRDKRAVYPILRWLIREPEPVVAALRSMGPVAEEEVLKMNLLRDRSPEVRRNASRILEEAGTRSSLIELRHASADPRDSAAALAAKNALDAVTARMKEQKVATSQPATMPR